MFERSKSGQQNRAIFFGVDYVCYIEGGGGVKDAAPDLSFWYAVLRTLRPDLKIKFAPRGGKPVLEKIAREIVSENISDTLVAMDSDYDDFRGRKILDERVLYSYGYSWENDVLTKGNLERIYCALCHCGEPSHQVKSMISENLTRLGIELRNPTKADFYALCGGSSMLPRKAPGRVITTCAVGLPKLNKKEVLKLTRAVNDATKAGRTVVDGGAPSDSIRYCVGHIFAFAVRLILRATISANHGKLTLPSEHLRDVALLTFPAFLRADPTSPVASYHAAQCAAI